MKKYILLIVILSFTILSINAKAQTPIDSIHDKAFEFLLNKKYDSAFLCYLYLKENYRESSRTAVTEYIADHYLSMGDTAAAEKNFLECIDFFKGKDTLDFSLPYSCKRLAWIYFGKKQYRKALVYLDSSKLTNHVSGSHMTVYRGFVAKLEFAHIKAACYYNLGLKDSAISAMLPIVFQTAGECYMDTIPCDSAIKFFVSVVDEMYGKKFAKTLLIEALENVSYNYKLVAEPGRMFKFLTINCSINYLNTVVRLDYGSTMLFEQNEPIPEYYRKEDFIKDFKKSPCYRIIMRKLATK